MTITKRIEVFGLGYIGLPTAALFAVSGATVIGVDVRQGTVDTLNEGRTHIFEPGLDAVVKEAVSSGSLRATLVPEPADVFIIAVPTPFKENHEPDLSYVEAATRALAPQLAAGNLVILESTSPVGTTDKMVEWLRSERPDLTFPEEGSVDAADISIAYCPERVLPGQILRELRSNDRIIGGISNQCAQAATEVYQLFVTGKCVVTNARTAELAKLSENAYRDVNIAFANELSLLSDSLDIDVWELIGLANLHPRVNILNPGPGVGGHCIAVDPWFIVHSAPDDVSLIPTARRVNDGKPSWVVEKVKAALTQKGSGSATVACFGLAYKPNIDDLRESPAVAVVQQLAKVPGVRVIVVEPHVTELPSAVTMSNVEHCSIGEALDQADVIVGLVAHDAFVNLDPGQFGGRPVLDTVGMWK